MSLSIGESPLKHLEEDGKKCEYSRKKSEVIR